jgi:hypothetical protein
MQFRRDGFCGRLPLHRMAGNGSRPGTEDQAMKALGTTTISGRREWELARDATVRLDAGAQGIQVRADCGTVLVTREGDLEDHVLEAGDAVLVTGTGLVVAWALDVAHLTVDELPKGALPRAGRPLHAAA